MGTIGAIIGMDLRRAPVPPPGNLRKRSLYPVDNARFVLYGRLFAWMKSFVDRVPVTSGREHSFIRSNHTRISVISQEIILIFSPILAKLQLFKLSLIFFILTEWNESRNIFHSYMLLQGKLNSEFDKNSNDDFYKLANCSILRTIDWFRYYEWWNMLLLILKEKFKYSIPNNLHHRCNEYIQTRNFSVKTSRTRHACA